MKEIENKQQILLQHLKHIQELAVTNVMSEHKANDNIEELLYAVSFESIYRVLEWIDGYSICSLKIDLIDKETGQSMKNGIELHDKCADYLRHS